MSLVGICLSVILTTSYGLANCHHRLRNVYPTFDSLPVLEDVGEPLILTSYIQSGDVDMARKLAKFGYEEAPLLLWLQGGPGVSSLFGLFGENGPFSVDETGSKLITRPSSWHRNHSIIYIDSPVGTGYSFTERDEGYATNQTQIGSELYTALVQFLWLFPELQTRDFFITGESYAGKYIPALGYTIYKNNPLSDLKINLKGNGTPIGLAIGNGFTDPLTQSRSADLLFSLGLIDRKYADGLRSREDQFVEALLTGNYSEAYNINAGFSDVYSGVCRIENEYNYLDNAPSHFDDGSYTIFVQDADVRRALHVGNSSFSNGDLVSEHLVDELLVSVKPWVEELLNNSFRVVFYNGQLDLAVPYMASEAMFQTFNFDGAEEYARANRTWWYVEGVLAGYFKSAGTLTEILVRDAGHMVPTDQPAYALDLLRRVIEDRFD
ncbi:unnamed protein product [Timema podura]|uniref:Carboxypeptidase n=1 Tax=Timema podura TaxID=61482 RepID=A0ABN7NXX5_TIMPD|nr:unnamed protein product [Timema podura]